ncbi:MAG: MBOAT family protein [Oscillospiraceae bacterium]|nr:MBOAT family protein [Oscillospiraceae bacterium]
MIFSSISFLFFFLPALLAVYFLVPRRWRGTRNTVLLLFSIAFYAWAGPRFVPLVLISGITSYLCGLYASPANTQRTRHLAVAICCTIGLGLLGWFKYAGFFAETVAQFAPDFPIPHIILPIGISFYTFQSISYVVDIYRGHIEPQRNPLRVMLYIALFPQLVAGPIVRYETIGDALEHRKETVADFSEGLTRLFFGLGKKLLIAGPMGRIADAIFAYDPSLLSAPLAWTGALAYAMQIYFDFSAYSDMAIGLGRMFGFRFLENFNYPYIARSITEFWRRWHISLSSWFRDYVYIPLGGSRKGPLRLVGNLFVVWLLTGFWHGAAWNFVVWGLWFFVLLMGEKFLWGKLLDRLPAVIRWVYAMALVTLSWVFFRAPDLGHAMIYLSAMFGGSSGEFNHTLFYLLQFWPEWLIACAACFPIKLALEKALEARRDSPTFALIHTWAPKLLALLLLALAYTRLVTEGLRPFIYFQF